jgi:protein SCO1/2
MSRNAPVTVCRRCCQALGAGLLALASTASLAHGTVQQHAVEAAARGNSGEAATVKLHDISVLNQDGEAVRFASEVVGDRLLVLTLFYGTCKTTCPVINAVFSALQGLLGERLGRDVRLVSLSVDPSSDRPARLKALARKHGARPGWVWVTGDKQAIDRVLDGLNSFTPDFTQHPVMVLIGDPRSGRWSRLFGFPDPEAILVRLDQLQAARAGASAGAALAAAAKDK